MVDVGDAVAQAHGDGLWRVVRRAVSVVQDAHARLVAEVQAAAVALKNVHNAQALLVVLEAAGVYLRQRALSGVAEWGMPQIVPQRYRLGQIFVQRERPRDGARKAADLQRVGQARAVVVALRLEKDLRLVLEAAERFGVGDTVDIPLKAGADAAFVFGRKASARIFGQKAIWADYVMLGAFSFFSGTGHCSTTFVSFWGN